MAFDRSRRAHIGNGEKVSHSDLSQQQVKRASRTRFTWGVISAVCLLLAVVFLIVVEVGDTSVSSGRTNIYFIKLDLTNVVPTSVPNAVLLNSIARTLGLHDFYTVGLWGYCEGYNGQGVTQCSDPRTLYYFNPVDIIASELLAGASIQLPPNISSVLDLVRNVSRIMFAFFLTGACLSFVLIPFQLLMVRTRWWACVMAILSFLNAALIVVASVIATVMFILMRNIFTSASEVNIEASIGNTMFAMMWIASAFALFAFIIDICLMCCCASRRDVRRGKKRGSKKAYESS